MASSLVDELTTAASHAAGARYFTYAIFALLIYDHSEIIINLHGFRVKC